MTAPIAIAPIIETSATLTMVQAPRRKNLMTAHWVNGRHFASSSCPLSDSRLTASATMPARMSTVTSDTNRVIRLPRGPSSSARNEVDGAGAFTASSLDREPVFEPRHGRARREGEEEVGDRGAEVGGDEPGGL